MNPKEFAAQYYNEHPNCELTGEPGDQVHHIFGKWCDALRYNEFNLCTLKFVKHDGVEFRDLQEISEEIFDMKIKKIGGAWIEFAKRWGGKTWRIYCDKRGIAGAQPDDFRSEVRRWPKRGQR